MTRIVFLDTETTGLSLDDDIWEIAAIVRAPGRPDVERHFFVEHDLDKAAKLPDSFRADHDRRYDPSKAITRAEAAARIWMWTAHRAHIVGAVPNFDTERLALLLREHDLDPGWHYHLIDVENLAIGWLAAQGVALDLPWDSIALTTALGVPAPEDRHTALADARWARDTYDAVLSPRPVGRWDEQQLPLNDCCAVQLRAAADAIQDADLDDRGPQAFSTSEYLAAEFLRRRAERDGDVCTCGHVRWTTGTGSDGPSHYTQGGCSACNCQSFELAGARRG